MEREALKLALEALEQTTTAMLRVRDELAERGARPITNKHHQALWDSSFAAYTEHALPAATTIRKALAQPEQEPVAMRMPKVGDKVICLEDESLGTIVSLTAGGSPDIKFDDGSHGTYLLREFAELFCYASTPQRPWVGLTEDERDHLTGLHLYAMKKQVEAWIGGVDDFAQAIGAKLKEKNT